MFVVQVNRRVGWTDRKGRWISWTWRQDRCTGGLAGQVERTGRPAGHEGVQVNRSIGWTGRKGRWICWT